MITGDLSKGVPGTVPGAYPYVFPECLACSQLCEAGQSLHAFPKTALDVTWQTTVDRNKPEVQYLLVHFFILWLYWVVETYESLFPTQNKK